MAINTDSFTYSNGALETVSGGLWINKLVNTSFAQISVASNKCQITTAVVNAYYQYNATYASENVYAQIKLDTLGAGWEIGLAINYTADDNINAVDCYNLACYDNGGGTTNIECYRVLNGSGTLLGSGNSSAISAGDVVKLTHESGDAIKGYKNGVLLSGVGGTDSTYSDPTSGFYMDSSAGSAWRADDWEGGDIAAALTTAQELPAWLQAQLEPYGEQAT